VVGNISMKDSRYIKIALALFLVVVIPITSYLFLKQSDDVYLELKKHYTQISDSGDTIFYHIPHFVLIDQDSNVFDSEILEDNIYLVDFIFTRCPTICPKMKSAMLGLQKDLGYVKDLKLLSISIDPEHDTPKVLKVYAAKDTIDTKQWKFLTGDKQKIYDLAGKGFKLSARDDGGNFTHSSRIVLVDKSGIIRGYYNALQEMDVERLAIETKMLLKSYRIKAMNKDKD